MFFLSCTTNQKDIFHDFVLIQGIHDDPEILRADSYFLQGKLKEAAELFTTPKREVSKQLYCQARLAEMDYYLRELYGKNHINYALDSAMLPDPHNDLDSFYAEIHYFFTAEKLDTAVFIRKWERAAILLGEDHYIVNKGHSILGEYFYTMKFNNALLDFHFKKHQTWCKSLPREIYDCFWTNIRLTSSGTYARNHLESVARCNEMIEEKEWKKLLDSIHLSLALNTRAYIQFRFDRYKEAYEDNLSAISLSRLSKAVPVYQEALKSQLTVTNFWLQDSLWSFYIEELKRNIDSTGADYVNYHRHVARFYHEREKYTAAMAHHALAIRYVLEAQHLNKPVLESLCHLYSSELEQAGQYKQAIEIYTLGDIGHFDSTWTFLSLVDSVRLVPKYQYVSMARYGHIYFSWFVQEGRLELLDKAEELALLAHQLYYRDVDTRDENALVTFSYERNMVLELLCMIYAEKYLRYHDGTSLFKYHAYAEENRGSIFWKDMKSGWKFDSILISLLLQEQVLNAENKRLKNQRIISQPALDKNIVALRELHSKIQLTYPEYYKNAGTNETPGMEEIQDSLRQGNTSLLSFDVIDHEIYLLWLQGCSEELFKIELSVDRRDQLETLTTWMSTKNEISAQEYSSLAYGIWQWLIPERVKADINSQWIIIPDGYFHRLNLEALVTNLSGIEDGFESLKWLVLEKEISYTPLIKSCLHKKQNSHLTGKNVSGFAWSDEYTLSKLNRTVLPELPGCINEMASLGQAFPGAKIFSGRKASRDNFAKSYEDPETRFIYLAIHGKSNSTRQDDICFYFRTDSGEIDTFYGYELLPILSHVEIVILSACETAKGRIVEGEGNYNLPRYFLINGASTVISSLWLLDDNATSVMYSSFYKDFENGTISKGLKEVKTGLIHKYNFRYARPYYWANMVIQI